MGWRGMRWVDVGDDSDSKYLRTVSANKGRDRLDYANRKAFEERGSKNHIQGYHTNEDTSLRLPPKLGRLIEMRHGNRRPGLDALPAMPQIVLQRCRQPLQNPLRLALGRHERTLVAQPGPILEVYVRPPPPSNVHRPLPQ